MKKFINKITIIFLFIVCISCDKSNEPEYSDSMLLGILRENVSSSLKNLESANTKQEYIFFWKTNSYTEYAKRIFSYVQDKKNEQLKSTNKIKGYSNTEINLLELPICFNGEFTEIESILIKELFHDLKGKADAEIVLIFNTYCNFIQNFLCNDNQRERMIYTFEAIKLIFKDVVSNNEELSGLRLKSINNTMEEGEHALTPCQHDCISDKLDSWNWVDWLFAAANPPLNVLALYLSCVVQCAESTVN
jgi:hypothetical protein